MGSSSYNKSTAVDNRLAVTDQALGVSSSGTGNNVALGNVFNLTAGGSSGSKAQAGGSVSLSVMDGGAIGQAFDFAGNALSQMLASVIDGQRAAQSAANYQADTVSAALQQSAQVQAQAQEKTLAWLSENGKILAGGGLLLLVGLWIWKGKR